MKDLGKNTVKPWITNVIVYIQTENCETKFLPLQNEVCLPYIPKTSVKLVD